MSNYFTVYVMTLGAGVLLYLVRKVGSSGKYVEGSVVRDEVLSVTRPKKVVSIQKGQHLEVYLL